MGVVPLWMAAGRFPELSGAFPRTILVTIAALAILLIVRSLVGPDLPNGDGRRQVKALVTPILVAVASIIAVIGMRFFGYFPAMVGLGIALYFILAGQRRLLYISAIAITMLFIFVVFAVLLGVPLSTDQFFG